MKIIEQPNHIVRSSGVTDSVFSLAATSSAFTVLSSGLYSNKPLAVIRELACNAQDAHVAAGRRDIPIRIVLPTHFEPTLVIEDFGIGLDDFDVRGGWEHPTTGEQLSVLNVAMSDEEMVEAGYVKVSGIYNTYFKSTKTTSDDFIGQLGLGSKSPYSYASTFTVEVNFNGKHRVYTCYKNEANLPAISLMTEYDTEEPNGIRISIPVEPKDCSKFLEAATQALLYFTPRPDLFMGTDPHTLPHISYEKDDKWKWRDAGHNSKRTGAYAIQGFVSYPIDSNILLSHGLTTAGQQVVSSNIDVFVPIGTVTSAASREALQYDQTTIDNLIHSLHAIKNEMRATFQAEFDTATSEYEAAVIYHRLINDAQKRAMFVSLVREQAFTWNGVGISNNIQVHALPWGVTTFRYTDNKRNRKRFHSQEVLHSEESDPTFVIDNTVQFLFVSVHTGARTALKKYMESKHENQSCYVFQTPSKDGTEIARKAAVEFCAKFGFPLKMFDHTVYRQSRATGVRIGGIKRDAKSDYYVWRGFNHDTRFGSRVRRVYSRSTWLLTPLYDNQVDGKELLYVDTVQHGVVNSQISNKLDLVLKFANQFGANIDQPIYGLSMVDKRKLLSKGAKLINLVDVVDSFVKRRISQADVKTFPSTETEIYTAVSKVWLTRFRSWVSNGLKLDATHPISQLLALHANSISAEAKLNIADLVVLATMFGYTVTTQSNLDSFKDLVDIISKRYTLMPMLVSHSTVSVDYVVPIQKYITDIDKLTALNSTKENA